ncbi:M29 family metallopeptidase [Streptomyces stackebrandtii]|uniref:aminopeptidase n=1 Tax=Streptomyces stackebrandtii TaxID=3051177 RepID=UPI0028DBC586|nr:aminopeptidase [Streptomyces sp. DSM 40976]
MIDSSIWAGVQSLLDDYVGLRSADTVVVLYTSDSYESAVWVSAALELRDVNIVRVWMAPIRDDDFEGRLASALPSPAVLSGRLVVLTFERDTMSHTRALADALGTYDPRRCVVFRAISAGSELFSQALSVSPDELSARNTAVLERCTTASRLHITTASGTDLHVTIDSERHRWISNRGSARPGGFTVIPAGEVATFPAAIEGVLVADFAFNVNAITDIDARLEKRPVSVWVSDGRAVEYECDDPTIKGFIDACFAKHCSHYVGELGFGTNSGVSNAIPMNSHINERRPGVHLGFGQHNQPLDVVPYQCSIHLDLIAKGGLIWVDGDPVPVDLEHILPSARRHPENLREADVSSPEDPEIEVADCCGILTNEGFHMFSS